MPMPTILTAAKSSNAVLMIQSLMIITYDRPTDLRLTGLFKVSKALWNLLAHSHQGTDLYGSIRTSCCASQSPEKVLTLEEGFIQALLKVYATGFS